MDKVLIFSHKSDIDGAGGVVLAKLAFKDIVFELCETFDIDQKFEKYIDSKKIYEFDKIFVTDMCIGKSTISRVNEDKYLKGKVKIFDHHKTNLENGLDKYEFVTIKISDEKGKCSGTSLFYEYLLKEGMLNPSNVIDEFVEITRQYDTWEWKTKYNNEKARDLFILFDIIYPFNYIEKMYLKLSSDLVFDFTVEEEMIITVEKQKIEQYVDKAISNMHIIETPEMKYAVIYAEQYRNDIAETLRQRGSDLDFVAIVKMYDKSVSYRQINTEFDVSKIAQKYGGKGHKEAAAHEISDNVLEKAIDDIFNLN